MVFKYLCLTIFTNHNLVKKEKNNSNNSLQVGDNISPYILWFNWTCPYSSCL